MAHYVTLKQKDLDIIIDVMGLVLEYKEKALSKLSWHQFETRYLPGLLETLKHNLFKHVRSDNNISLWLIDQICHSRIIVPGVDHKEGIPIVDTPLGAEAVAILRAVSKGQISYNVYCMSNNFDDLFNIDK